MLEEKYSRLDDIEQHINELEDIIMETTQSEQQKEKHIKKKIRAISTAIILMFALYESKNEKKEKKVKNVFGVIMADNFLNLYQETDILVQEIQRVSNKMNQSRPIQKHFIIKLAKVKYKKQVLNAARKKHKVIFKALP